MAGHLMTAGLLSRINVLPKKSVRNTFPVKNATASPAANAPLPVPYTKNISVPAIADFLMSAMAVPTAADAPWKSISTKLPIPM